MKINFPKIISAHNIALASFYVIILTSSIGLARSLETDKNRLTPNQWHFAIAGFLTLVGGCCLLEENSGDSTLEDGLLERRKGDSEDSRGSSSGDIHVHTHIVNAELDQSLAKVTKDVEEMAQQMGALNRAFKRQATAKADTAAALAYKKEQQARGNLIEKISDFGTGANPLEALQGAIQICSDTRLWIEPAKTATVFQTTERFYREGRIWPTVQVDGIMWSLSPDYDPPEESLESEVRIEQTPFRPFCNCPRCKYLGEDGDSCAVVPFGYMGDPSRLECREFVSEDDLPF